jgi:hypothetical protein
VEVDGLNYQGSNPRRGKRGKRFSCAPKIQRNSVGAQLFPRRKKWLRREADHSSTFSAKVKNEWSYTSAFLTCLYGMYGDFTYKDTGRKRENTCIYLKINVIKNKVTEKIYMLMKCINFIRHIFAQNN